LLPNPSIGQQTIIAIRRRWDISGTAGVENALDPPLELALAQFHWEKFQEQGPEFINPGSRALPRSTLKGKWFSTKPSRCSQQ
jgi:hypothetical protein